MKAATIDQPRDDFAHVEAALYFIWNNPVELIGRVVGRLDRVALQWPFGREVPLRDDLAAQRDRVRLGIGRVVAGATDLGMQIAAAQIIHRHDFAGGGFHERRAG